MLVSDSLQVALKEWAVVQRALLDGTQTVMLRKGGIIEETGDFDLRAEQFLIQPTYAHETERVGDIRPEYASILAGEEARKADPAIVRFEVACVVADVIRVDHPDRLIGLGAEHIWSEKFLRGRFDWEPYKPIFVIVARAYALPTPVEISWQPQYGGCKSWSELAEPVSTVGATAAIADGREFEHRLGRIRAALGG